VAIARDAAKTAPNEENMVMRAYDDHREEAAFDDIVGSSVKCAKEWFLDGVKLETGPDGARATILMSTAIHARSSWEDGRIKVRDRRRYVDSDPPREKLLEGWKPYTIPKPYQWRIVHLRQL
jgi:hypothetical protein